MTRRYDLYGFKDDSLEKAAALVEAALGVRLARRDSSYRGIYYSGRIQGPQDCLLQENNEASRWRSQYPEAKLTLMISNAPDMDAIVEKLTHGRSDPVLLTTILHEDEPQEAEDDTGTTDHGSDGETPPRPAHRHPS